MQLSLFEHQESHAYEDYIILTGNKHAHDFIVNDKTWNCLILYGPSGSGKTHLAHIWQKLNKAIFINLNNFVDAVNSSNAFILEDIEKIQNEVLFLHCYNYAKENGKKLLLTSSLIPNALAFKLNDLKSRILSTISVGITLESEELFRLLLIKQLTDRQLQVNPRIIDYILTQSERSFERIKHIVDTIDKKSVYRSTGITIPFVRSVLNLGDSQNL
ncbi:HdaA/DnaA family protein [Candidatus Mesenet endosymbiont of Phosphuga atrata]|uniref:HdaA/DnaA family protein n=1 Tax=Candidatus Mesenet endosymbiont of Phosphuga atrata TaxID=3066221 RepID=UPI0030CB19BA